MNNFIISDPLLLTPAQELLEASNATAYSYGEGVSSYIFTDKTVFIINQSNFSPKSLVRALSPLKSSKNVFSVSSSAIQYFAGEMKSNEAIFSMIDSLAKHPVVVGTSPIFRMTKITDPITDEDYKHEISFAAIPENLNANSLSYITSDKQLIDETTFVEQFRKNNSSKFTSEVLEKIKKVSLPLIFYLAGLNKDTVLGSKIFEKKDVDNKYGFDRVAYAELMLRFPSRSPNIIDKNEDGYNELEFLENVLNIKSDVASIWKHNRLQWDLVSDKKLSFFNKHMPKPTNLVDDENYNKYNHLIINGIDWLIERFGIEIPNLKYVGVPIFARNGITIALGQNGIVKHFNAASFDEDLRSTLKFHLNNIINCENIKFSQEKVSPAIVSEPNFA